MATRHFGVLSFGILALVIALAVPTTARADDQEQYPHQSGIIKVRSAYGVNETVTRLKKDVSDKGIRFFFEVDQRQLAADAGISIRPSTLLVFGNPPLGTLFVRANPLAGLDWPVRMLVLQDANGDVWAAYTDFSYIANRHQIEGADLEALLRRLRRA